MSQKEIDGVIFNGKLRTDVEDYFKLNEALTQPEMKHTPFIAIGQTDDGKTSIDVVYSLKDLLEYFVDDVTVINQWTGKWRSDYFIFRVGDIRAHFENN